MLSLFLTCKSQVNNVPVKLDNSKGDVHLLHRKELITRNGLGYIMGHLSVSWNLFFATEQNERKLD